jgi:hypothetical protein
MPFNIKLTPATIKALTKFVQALDQHRFGAVMFILVILSVGAVLTILHLPSVMA